MNSGNGQGIEGGLTQCQGIYGAFVYDEDIVTFEKRFYGKFLKIKRASFDFFTRELFVHLQGETAPQDVGDHSLFIQGEIGEGYAALEIIGSFCGEKTGVSKLESKGGSFVPGIAGQERDTIGVAEEVF